MTQFAQPEIWKQSSWRRLPYENFRVRSSQSQESATWKHVQKLIKIKHTIIIFGIFTRDDDINPLLISPHSLRLNMQAYIKCLEVVALPWIRRAAASRLCIFQHDFASRHTNEKIRSWLSYHFCNLITLISGNLSPILQSPWLLCVDHRLIKDQHLVTPNMNWMHGLW